MSQIDVSLVLVALFFSLYGLACSLECGIGLRLLLDPTTKVRSLFTPLWEVTNIFLVFGFTGFTVLFNNALTGLSHKILSVLAVALVALLLRGCVVLKIFYLNQSDRLSRIEAGLFALCNLAIPLSFAAAGTYLISGQQFWQSGLGWLLMVTTLLGLIAIGFSFTADKNRRVNAEGCLAYILWLAALGGVLPWLVAHHHYDWAARPILTLQGLSLAGLLGLLTAYWRGYHRIPLIMAGVIGLATPLLLAWANRPYLINGHLMLSQAFGAASYAWLVVAGLGLSLPLTALGFWLFYKLLQAPVIK